MRKIPTLFRRDPENPKRVLSEVTPGCEWVLVGEGRATRKYDGTCVFFDEYERWWARREVKPGKDLPQGFQPVDADPVTGKTVGWVPIDQSPFAAFHAEALLALEKDADIPGRTYELCGPKINGNPEHLEVHALMAHMGAEQAGGPAVAWGAPRSFDGIRQTVVAYANSFGWEGLVFHHQDGRMAKIKARDFERLPR